MSITIKDTDYLGISTRIRAMENALLTRERMEQVLDARTDEEAAKILQDCGYEELDPKHPERMDAAIAAAREATLRDIADTAPDARYIDIFKLKYDYHNIKSILKAEAMGVSPDHMLTDMGRIRAAELKDALAKGELDVLSQTLADAAAEAKDVLDTTGDGQLCDAVLDRWCYLDMERVAEATGSEFLCGYVRAQIDAVNLRTLVRTMRMGKNNEFLRGVLLEGGEIAMEAVLKAGENAGALGELYEPTRLAEAAEVGVQALHGEPLTEFEKLCDDAVSEYLADAQFVPFGEAPLLAYLAARETEYTNLRILLLGRSAGLEADVIRSRLRKSYV